MRFLGLVGMGALLASCNVSVTPVGGGPSSTLQLKAISSYTSQYSLQNAALDQNGNVLAAGTSIICDNLSTQLQVGVTWTGDLQQIGIQFKGLKTGAVSSARVFGDKFGAPDYSGSGLATITINPGVAPLKVSSGLSAQSIVVTPVSNVNVKGYTYVQAIGLDSSRNLSNVVSSTTAIPVADCS